jgi:Sensors of blue-light using FAD
LLIQMLYVSRAVGPQTTTVTASILATAQAHNRQHGISGVLCQGQGLYIQLLEGERSALNVLYTRIVADRRHKDVELLLQGEIASRRFPDWSMAHVALRDDDPMVRLHHPEFDPYAAPGAFVLKMVEELCAAGHRLSLHDGA